MSPILAALVVGALIAGQELVSETEAAWTDSEYVSGAVGSGSWPSAGYGLGTAARVNSAGGVTILPIDAPPLPWNGARTLRDQTNPGTATQAGAGPYASSALVGVNSLGLSSAASNSAAVGANACGSYRIGATGTPAYCSSGTPIASASATVASMRLRGSVLSLAGAVAAVNTDIVSISTAAQALSTSVSCDLTAGTSTRTLPAAANATTANPNGTVRIGGQNIRIPGANATTQVPDYGDVLVGYRDIRLSSTASAANAASAFTKLTLTGQVSLLNLGLLPLTFSVDLVAASCGPGSPPATAAIEAPAARMAELPAEPTTTVPTTTVPTTTVPTTTATPTTTAPTTATPTTTAPTTATPTTTAPTTTTTAPPEPTTVYTGPADGWVTELTFEDGVTCTAEAGADYSGTVQFTCSDDTTISAIGSDLVAAEGLWTPTLVSGTPRPVVQAQLTLGDF